MSFLSTRLGAGIALLLLSMSMAFGASAAEKARVCAKYRTNYDWSKGYEVNARIMKGSELNAATRSFDYTSFSTYVVIFWDDDEASVIEMERSYIGHFGVEGEDQLGRKWEISRSSFCR